jgi:hypothetical protein
LKIPRDLSGVALAKALSKLGYQVGTLSAILGDVAAHLKITRDELLQRLFG